MLFAEFQPVSSQEWLTQIHKDLKGKPLEEILTKNYENIPIKPFYTAEDVNEVFSQALAQSLLREKKAATKNAIPDPIGKWLQTAENCHEKDFQNIVENFSEKSAIEFDVTFLHNAGANAVQEIATTIALVNAYLQKLINTHEAFLEKISIKVAVGSNFFMEIAKLQVLPFLINRLLSLYVAKETNVYPCIVATNAFINKSVRDAYNNIIRSTLEIMAARLGSADEVLAIPYDYFLENKNSESQYIAECIDKILHYESKIDFVQNPTQGCYFLEYLAYELAQRSWQFFQEIEKFGGIITYERQALLSKQIKKVARQKVADFIDQKIVLVGVNKYPNPQEKNLPLPPTKNIEEFFVQSGIKVFRLEEFLEKN